MGYGAVIGFQITLRAPDGTDHVLCNYPNDTTALYVFSLRRARKSLKTFSGVLVSTCAQSFRPSLNPVSKRRSGSRNTTRNCGEIFAGLSCRALLLFSEQPLGSSHQTQQKWQQSELLCGLPASASSIYTLGAASRIPKIDFGLASFCGHSCLPQRTSLPRCLWVLILMEPDKSASRSVAERGRRTALVARNAPTPKLVPRRERTLGSNETS